jgi:hypothetical protein
MKKLAMLAIGAAVAIAALGAESSAGKPSAEATKFVSKRYGYSVVLAGQWKAKYARTGWWGNFPLMDSGEVDVFTDSTGERFFIVAATRVPAGTTLRQWERSHAEVMSAGSRSARRRAHIAARGLAVAPLASSWDRASPTTRSSSPQSTEDVATPSSSSRPRRTP